MELKRIKLYIKRLYSGYVKENLWRVILALILSAIVASTTSATAWLLDPAVKKIFIDKDRTYALVIPILIIIVFAAKGTSLYFARSIIIVLGYRVIQKIQNQMARHVLLSDTQTLESKHSGKYISSFLYDVGQIQGLISTGVLNLMKDTLTLITLMCVMFYQNWKLALFSIIMMPLAAFFAKSLGKRMGKATTQSAVSVGNFTMILTEILKGSKIIKIYQREDVEEKKSKDAIKDLTDKQIKIGTVLIRATPIMETLTGIMIAGFIFFAGILISAGEIGINNFFSFLAAMMLAYQPVRSLATLSLGINQGLSAGRRILPIIDTKNSITSNDTKPKLKLNNADIKFKEVNFSYDENNIILKNININIEGGKINAIVGLSGAGKSTLLNLIPRIYDKSSGDIIIDNQSIYEVNLASLRNQISIVDQNTTLFDDTVFNNIIYAKPNATREDVLEASRLSMSEDFIKKLEKGFDTLVGENGTRLSGGEKQRISIARAFLRKSKIILLDEPTSSLDSETENKIQLALKKLTENKTTIVIAHRLSTIQNASKIFVIDNGNVVSTGTHKELLNNSNIYTNFYNKQIKSN